jgi:dethiobiotin synthetase
VTRPGRLVVVTGSGTEVGKTWVASRLLVELRRRDCRVAVRKPAQSFSPGETTDAEILSRASGEAGDQVCPDHRSYPVPLAPPLAAEALGRPGPTMDDLVEELDRSWPCRAIDVGVVEGAGGAASPLALDGDTADLARRIRADLVVLVGEPVLGIINSARLSRLALHQLDMTVHLNRFDPASELHRVNRDWLADRDRFHVTTTLRDLADAASSGPPRL